VLSLLRRARLSLLVQEKWVEPKGAPASANLALLGANKMQRIIIQDKMLSCPWMGTQHRVADVENCYPVTALWALRHAAQKNSTPSTLHSDYFTFPSLLAW
jgi:hypothetical protein